MPAPPILHSFAYALDYLDELLADVPARRLTAQPAGIANHPMWVVGHLTLTTQELAGALGEPPWLPDGWRASFGTGSAPVDDPREYPSKGEAFAALRDAQSRLTRAVAALDDAGLDAPFPDPSYREVFPTLRHALTQVLVGHAAYHIGQVAVWRKAAGFPRLGRSFE